MDNDFLDSFSRLFGSNNQKSNCEICGYRIYLNKIKYIKNKMIKNKKIALQSKSELGYLKIINESHNEILQYLRNL